MNRILLCALTMCLSAIMYGQVQTTAFDSFISRIAKQYQVDIALSPELIPVVDSILDSGTRVTTIDDLLQLLVHEEHLTYRIVDGNKLMLRKEVESDPIQGIATIEGTIVDQEKLPLAYAAVHILNSTKGCQTDENGHFSLIVTDTTGIVQVDYLGYAPVQKK
ncbi:MAG TPA: carboxypeptidase-like regulatory domain-containing protein, partial [Saprospiraceae bacterium]|nr:carboxypeptidase-like regulatory domain-containing protein [Saprospiraceae bacterium]